MLTTGQSVRSGTGGRRQGQCVCACALWGGVGPLQRGVWAWPHVHSCESCAYCGRSPCLCEQLPDPQTALPSPLSLPPSPPFLQRRPRLTEGARRRAAGAGGAGQGARRRPGGQIRARHAGAGRGGGRARRAVRPRGAPAGAQQAQQEPQPGAAQVGGQGREGRLWWVGGEGLLHAAGWHGPADAAGCTSACRITAGWVLAKRRSAASSSRHASEAGAPAPVCRLTLAAGSQQPTPGRQLRNPAVHQHPIPWRPLRCALLRRSRSKSPSAQRDRGDRGERGGDERRRRDRSEGAGGSLPPLDFPVPPPLPLEMDLSAGEWLGGESGGLFQIFERSAGGWGLYSGRSGGRACSARQGGWRGCRWRPCPPALAARALHHSGWLAGQPSHIDRRTPSGPRPCCSGRGGAGCAGGAGGAPNC